ncbi:dienelactone hydrolase family protein [Thermocatellispora tengchongensis]
MTVADGTFDVPLWLPPSGRGPGILLVQEIFGVGAYIRQVAEDLAAMGYVVGAPDLFWRLQRDWRAEGPDALAVSLDLGSRFDFERGVADCAATLAHLRGLPEVTGPVGAVGFCLGGSLDYVLAATADPPPAAVISFYGSAVPGSLDLIDRITMPLLFVFGGSDPYIPREEVAKVERAAAGRPNIEMYVSESSGHAFHNFTSPQFHDPEAGPVVWELATTFLNRHLPVS